MKTSLSRPLLFCASISWLSGGITQELDAETAHALRESLEPLDQSTLYTLEQRQKMIEYKTKLLEAQQALADGITGPIGTPDSTPNDEPLGESESCCTGD